MIQIVSFMIPGFYRVKQFAAHILRHIFISYDWPLLFTDCNIIFYYYTLRAIETHFAQNSTSSLTGNGSFRLTFSLLCNAVYALISINRIIYRVARVSYHSWYWHIRVTIYTHKRILVNANDKHITHNCIPFNALKHNR